MMLLLVFSAALLLTGAQAALSSASDLCIQGCCGLTLNLPSSNLALSSDTSVISIPLLESKIPCCKCPIKSENTAQIQLETPPLALRKTFSPWVPDNPTVWSWCPPSCPCCQGCRHLDGCDNARRGGLPRLSVNTLRSTLALDALNQETRVCEPDNCQPDCLCRETLLQSMQDLLFPNNSESPNPPDSTVDDPVSSQHVLKGNTEL